MAGVPPPATLGALLATRNAQRLAAAVLRTRPAALDTLPCAGCGRTLAVATDAAHPVRNFEGRVVCGPCLKSARIDRRGPQYPPDPPRPASAADIDQWIREGYTVYLPSAPDPRPTLAEWIRNRLMPRNQKDH